MCTGFHTTNSTTLARNWPSVASCLATRQTAANTFATCFFIIPLPPGAQLSRKHLLLCSNQWKGRCCKNTSSYCTHVGAGYWQNTITGKQKVFLMHTQTCPPWVIAAACLLAFCSSSFHKFRKGALEERGESGATLLHR